MIYLEGMPKKNYIIYLSRNKDIAKVGVQDAMKLKDCIFKHNEKLIINGLTVKLLCNQATSLYY